MSTFDVEAFRVGFPALTSGIAFFDGPGGSQTPAVVGEAIARTLTSPLSNRGTDALSQRNAEDAVREFRSALADFTGADPRGIVYGRSATDLAYDLARTLGKGWRPGDEVVVTSLDHDSNVRPWIQAARSAEATVRWWELDPRTCELPLDGLRAVLSERTRVVAVTGASNLVGTIPDVRAAADLARGVGAHVHVDAVHLAAHELLDLDALGADSLVCSPYKFLGPHCGVLAASPALLEGLSFDKLVPSTDVVPERLELGTLPYEMMAGATAAVEVLAGLGEGSTRRERLASAFERVHEHETRLSARILEAVRALPGVTVWSRAERRTPTVYLTVDGRSGADIARHLVERDVLAPAGTFYAYEAAQRLGLDTDPGVRVGVAPYTNDDDVDRLLAGLRSALA